MAATLGARARALNRRFKDAKELASVMGCRWSGMGRTSEAFLAVLVRGEEVFTWRYGGGTQARAVAWGSHATIDAVLYSRDRRV